MQSQTQQTNSGPNSHEPTSSNSSPQIDVNYIISKVIQVVSDPKGCWPALKAQPEGISDIYFRYLGVLVAISTLCGFIGMTFIGISLPFVGHYSTPFFSGLVHAVIQFAVTLAGVYIAAMVLEMIVPKFEGSASRTDTFKLLAYAATPGLVGGILGIIPALAPLGMLFGIYGLYLYFQGIVPMLAVPESKRAGFFGISLLALIVTGVILGVIVGIFAPRAPIPNLGNITFPTSN